MKKYLLILSLFIIYGPISSISATAGIATTGTIQEGFNVTLDQSVFDTPVIMFQVNDK